MATSPPHITVIGAGAFGGWTALHLVRRGARVTLVDAWGAGHSRSSSGGETRIIRGVYGSDRIYVQWVARAFELWREAEVRWRQRLYHPTGVLWMCGADDAYVREAFPLLREVDLPLEELQLGEARARFPQIDFGGIEAVFFEAQAGYLLARRSCQAVAEAVAAEGGEVRLAAAAPGPLRGGRMERLELADGGILHSDLYVFACGPWLGSLFPEAIGERFLRVSRQEVFFFATPPGDPRFSDAGGFPIWMDMSGGRSYYGIPGNEHRGFKMADDSRDEPFDPTAGDRLPTLEGLARARAYLVRRFPDLAGAPLVESRVCQYENSPDGHLLFDRHPQADNVWFLGGGSGHGFKLGPALGEHAARILLDGGQPEDVFRLDRPGHGESIRTQFER